MILMDQMFIHQQWQQPSIVLMPLTLENDLSSGFRCRQMLDEKLLRRQTYLLSLLCLCPGATMLDLFKCQGSEAAELGRKCCDSAGVSPLLVASGGEEGPTVALQASRTGDDSMDLIIPANCAVMQWHSIYVVLRDSCSVVGATCSCSIRWFVPWMQVFHCSLFYCAAALVTAHATVMVQTTCRYK